MNALPSFVVLLLCIVLLPYICCGLRCLYTPINYKHGGAIPGSERPIECLYGSNYCRQTNCSTVYKNEKLEVKFWGCEAINDVKSCVYEGVNLMKYNYEAIFECDCKYGKKGQDMAFMSKTTSAQTTTTTETTVTPTETSVTTTETSVTTTPNTTCVPETSSKCVCAGSHRLMVETPLALVLPMLIGILPIFHDMFAMFAFCINRSVT